MDGQNQPRLKNLLQTLPEGFVVTTSWLEEQGITRQLASNYVASGWLERLIQGLYRRPLSGMTQATPDWRAAVLSAQRLMHHNFHVGGLTALDLQGHIHYLRLAGVAPVYLYGEDVPNWLLKLPLQANVVRRQAHLFKDPRLGVADLSINTWDGGEVTLVMRRWEITMSTPERAILETINEAPRDESFHNIDVLFESLVSLRPKLLTELLETCFSIKAKRLFMIYADKHDHAWRKHIDLTRVNFGTGDRALTEGGKLHPLYRITVPAELMPQDGSNGP